MGFFILPGALSLVKKGCQAIRFSRTNDEKALLPAFLKANSSRGRR
jgi:hypothetical protein